jgi:hypothetical protein
MGVNGVIACTLVAMALVTIPLVISVVTSFFPKLAAHRRSSGLLIDRGAASMLASLFGLAYYEWLTRFLPYTQLTTTTRATTRIHLVVGNALWFGAFGHFACAVAASPSSACVTSDVKLCRMCDARVEGFDHHCPFIAQCVGTHNRNCFFRFLLLSSAGCIYAACVSGNAFYECIAFPIANLRLGWGSSRPRPDDACRLVQEHALLFLPTMGTCILVCMLTSWQAFLRARGESTADFVRRWRFKLSTSN